MSGVKRRPVTYPASQPGSIGCVETDKWTEPSLYARQVAIRRRVVAATIGVVAVAIALVTCRATARHDKSVPLAGPPLKAAPSPTTRGPVGSATQPTSRGRLWKRVARWPPLWAALILVALGLALPGYYLLPSDEPQTVLDYPSPGIQIAVDKPGVHILAVLDGDHASDGWLGLDLFADNVKGGFTYVIENFDGGSDLLRPGGTWPRGPWTTVVRATALTEPTPLYSRLVGAPDMETELRYGALPPAGGTLVREDPQSYSNAGASFQVLLPSVALVGPGISQPSPTGHWYSPTGEVVVLAPFQEQTYETDVADPVFSQPGMWTDPQGVVSPYWSGTDPVEQAQENHSLFWAGLLLGIAGSAVIVAIQDIASRYRAWRESKKDTAQSAPS